MQYEKQEEYPALIEVISRFRIERETHMLIAFGWKQHIQCSNSVHAVVGRENVLDLAVRLRQRNKTPCDTGGDNTVHQGDIAVTVGRPSTDPSTDLEHAIEFVCDPCCIRHVLEGRIRDDEVEGVLGEWQRRGHIYDDSLVNARICGHNRIDVYADDAPSFASQVPEVFPIKRRILIIGRATAGAKIKYNVVWTQQSVNPLLELNGAVAT